MNFKTIVLSVLMSSQCISADEEMQQRILPFFSGRIPIFFSSGLQTLGNSTSFSPISNLFSGQVPNIGSALPGSSGSDLSQLSNFNSAINDGSDTNQPDSSSSNHSSHNGLFGFPAIPSPISGVGSLRPSILPNVSSFFNLPFIPGASSPPSSESATTPSISTESQLESSQPETEST